MNKARSIWLTAKSVLSLYTIFTHAQQLVSQCLNVAMWQTMLLLQLFITTKQLEVTDPTVPAAKHVHLMQVLSSSQQNNQTTSHPLEAQQQTAEFVPGQQPPVAGQTEAVRKWLCLKAVQPAGVCVKTLCRCAFMRLDRAASKNFLLIGKRESK